MADAIVTNTELFHPCIHPTPSRSKSAYRFFLNLSTHNDSVNLGNGVEASILADHDHHGGALQ